MRYVDVFDEGQTSTRRVRGVGNRAFRSLQRLQEARGFASAPGRWGGSREGRNAPVESLESLLGCPRFDTIEQVPAVKKSRTVRAGLGGREGRQRAAISSVAHENL